MTSPPLAITIRNLSKSYRLYQRPMDALLEAMTRKQRHMEYKALDDINLELRRGEIVGIMGRNGAGKSTLLKIIAGTLAHTSGELEVNGRITAILELGTGFNPEHTGRRNIRMGGMCLGMSRGEIEKKIDSIIEFSELEEVIDQPFKTYSTGMQARLTFSTAISMDPDILIVDEALSVGDAKFQMKCFTWLQGLRKRQTTILLVSHDANTVTTVCDRAMVLESGQVYYDGSPKEASAIYMRLLFGNKQDASSLPLSTEQREAFSNDGQDANGETESPTQLRYGLKEVKISDYGLLDNADNRVNVAIAGADYTLFLRAHCLADVDDLVAGFAIKDRRGTVLWGMNNLTEFKSPCKVTKSKDVFVSVKCTMNLAAGTYFINLGLGHMDSRKIDFIENAMEFRVIGTESIFTISTVFMNEIFTLKVEDEQACRMV